MFASQILYYQCGNVLIPDDEKIFRAWYTVTLCFFSVLLFLRQNYGLGLGFRFSLSVDPVMCRSATQRLSLKTQLKIEFLGSFSGRRKNLYKTLYWSQIFTLALFIIILWTINCKNSQSCPEQRAKNSYTADNFLNLIDSPPVLSTHITSTCLFICPPFSLILSFSLLFLYWRQCLQSTQPANFKMKSYFYQ